jgi:hypothetical protein
VHHFNSYSSDEGGSVGRSTSREDETLKQFLNRQDFAWVVSLGIATVALANALFAAKDLWGVNQAGG